MSNQHTDLPDEIVERVSSFCRRDADGNRTVEDMRGLVAFIVENAGQYPALLGLVSINEEAATKHIQETGDVPPGVKLVKTSAAEGSNVTHVQIVRGPAKVDPNH